MFKKNIFLILGIVFFILAGISYFKTDKTKPVVVNKILVKPSPTTNPTPTIQSIANSSNLSNPTNSPIPTNDPVPQSTNTPTPQPTNTLKISLSINGSSVGSVDVSPGANQCDVLSQALSNGKIQSLNMRFNNDLGTNAVYQINGIGKENAVWWTYKVNGQSPSQGCSHIKVNNGDNVLWEYIGN